METLKIIVSGGKDHFGAWVEDIEGIYGVGSTLDEIKHDIEAAIDIYRETHDQIPEILKKDYTFEFVFKVSGLVKYYNQFITLPAMENITGINQKLLWQYANGWKEPREKNAIKIKSGLMAFARQLENEKVLI